MSAARTYSPLPPMIPAGDDFRADPCGLRNPDPRPHTYGVRVCPCAAFATEPCRPTACIPAAPFRHTLCRFRPRWTATVWRNLQRHPHRYETYTFSAKEKDSETGLSYFGARYYSSDLSIWLSVDPMSDKYPSLSPYVYCADNPVKLVDPNGGTVVPFGLLEYYGKARYGNSHLGESQRIGIYDVIPVYDNNKRLIAYNAVREYSVNGETQWRTEYQMNPSDLFDFISNIKQYEFAANLIYSFGEPDWSSIAMMDKFMSGNLSGAFNELGKQWARALNNTDFWISVAISIAGNKLNKSQINQLADDLKKWIGPNAKGIINKKGDYIVISRDGNRRIRFDINNPHPHQNPHSHVEEKINGDWRQSGPRFPKDVKPE